MRTNTVLSFSIITAISLVPVALWAGAPGPRPANYEMFTLSQDDLAAMPNAADKDCQARAARTPNDLSLQVACNDSMTGRFEVRVRDAIRRTTRRAITAKQRQFTTDQRIWAETRLNACTEKWAGELNPSSNSYALAVSQCNAQETYRRALWIERYRR